MLLFFCCLRALPAAENRSSRLKANVLVDKASFLAHTYGELTSGIGSRVSEVFLKAQLIQRSLR